MLRALVFGVCVGVMLGATQVYVLAILSGWVR